MAIPSVAVGGPVTAYEINQLVQGVNAAGFIGIIPTVTAPVSGAVAVSPNGSVTFTNASTVSVNGCFMGTYDNYRVMVNISGRSAAATIVFRLRQAGTDISTATYNWVRQQTNGSSTNAPLTATAASMSPLDLAALAGQTLDGAVEVYGPAKATHTAMLVNTFSYVTTPTPFMWAVGMQNTTAAASDGFTIWPDTGGTITGVLRVYAYNNLS